MYFNLQSLNIHHELRSENQRRQVRGVHGFVPRPTQRERVRRHTGRRSQAGERRPRRCDGMRPGARQHDGPPQDGARHRQGALPGRAVPANRDCVQTLRGAQGPKEERGGAPREHHPAGIPALRDSEGLAFHRDTLQAGARPRQTARNRVRVTHFCSCSSRRYQILHLNTYSKTCLPPKGNSNSIRFEDVE